MSDIALFLQCVLASYRLAHMLAEEEGPFTLFQRVRSRLGADTQDTWLGRGASCPLCIGFWTSLAVTLVLWPVPSWQRRVLNWLSVAGGMTALHLWTE